MKIQVIHNEEAHEAALRGLENLMDSDPPAGSEQYAELELLALVIHDYESRHFPIPPPDAVEAIRFRMEQQGLTRRDLEKSLGSRARVSEVLNGRRRLSVAMVRKLHRQLQIPAEILVAEPKRRRTPVRKVQSLKTPRR
jgi:HTH-type transcriptional regulator/antitoxin HigA